MIAPRKEPHTALDGPQYYQLLKRQMTTLGAGYQPLNANLTAISELATNSFGLQLLTKGSAASVRSYIGAGSSSFSGEFEDLAGKPTTIGGYGITDFNSLGDARWSLLGHTHSYQPLDQTLTDFAALTIAANSLTIGTEAGGFTQTTFAASTFPARASTGDLMAKTITDFGLSLIDDADSAAARTSLGLVIGTNVQAYDADLTSWAAITPGSGWSTLLAATKPTTIGGYGITDFNSLGDARWSLLAHTHSYQPLDADLTNIASKTSTHEIFYRSATDTWSPVLMGPGVFFRGPYLTTMSTSTPAKLTADQTIASSSTLDLTGLDGPVIDVTGTTNITSITGLADGEYRMLRFPGAGLTLVQDTGTLELLGGVDLPVTANGLVTVAGGTAGLVTATESKDALNYSSQTFDNIYIKPLGRITFATGSSDSIYIGKNSESFGNYISISPTDYFTLIDRGSGVGVSFDTSLLTGFSKSYYLPNTSGTFSIIDASESLTNKKLGSLTTNGFVKTGSGDGTLSVDTATYLTANQAITLSGDISGTGATAITTAIGAGKVTLAMLANMATASLIYRKTAGTGAPEINTLATLKADLALPTITVGNDVIAKGSGSGNLSDSQITDDGSTIVLGNASGFVTVITVGLSEAVTIGSADITAPGLLFCDQASSGRLYSYLLDDGTLETDSATIVPTQHAVYSYILATAASLEGNVASTYLPLAGGTLTGQLITRAGTTGSNSAGIKLVSGSLQTTPQAGAVEFLTDAFYLTKTTGPTRVSIATCPSAGPITFAGTSAARQITVPNADCTMARTNSTNTFTGDQTFSAKIIGGAAIRLKVYTVAGLPAGTQGDTAMASDLLAPTFLAAAVGGGAVVGSVQYNGAAWVCG